MFSPTYLSLLLALLSAALADVKFTSPSAGASIPAGTISVTWHDSGFAPSLQDLTQYTLDLMVGGNEAGQMLVLTNFVSGASFASGDERVGTIPSGIAGGTAGGFFFRMTSTVETGGTIINYSDRFSITGLTGVTPAVYRQAAEALNGSPDGPPTSGNGLAASFSISSSAASTTSTPAALPPISTTPEAIVTVSATATTTTSPSATPPPGLSTGGKAAIITIIALVLLAGSAIAAVFLMRLRRQKQTRAAVAARLSRNPFLDDKAELAGSELTLKAPPTSYSMRSNATELSATGSEVFEMDDGMRRPELDHTAFRAELPG